MANMTKSISVRKRPAGKSAGAATVGDLDAVLKGFADPTRIRILSLLAAGELCVCDIVEILGLPQPAVSRHHVTRQRTPQGRTPGACPRGRALLTSRPE